MARQSSKRFGVRTSTKIQVALAALTAAANLTMGQVYQWASPTSDFWSNSAAWSPAGPIPTNSYTTQLTFVGGGSYLAANDMGTVLANRLTFDLQAGNLVTVDQGTSLFISTIKFGGTSPSIVVNGGGVNLFNSTLQSETGFELIHNGSGTVTLGEVYYNGVTSFTNTGSGVIVIPENAPVAGGPFASRFAGPNAVLNLANTGTGRIDLGNMQATSQIAGSGFNGQINVTAGTVKLTNPGGDVFSNATYLNIAAGATFDMNNNAEDMGGVSGNGTFIAGTAGINYLGVGNTFDFGGTIVGTAGITVFNYNTLNINSQVGGATGASWTGTLNLNRDGRVNLTVANAIQLQAVNVNNGTITFGGFDQTFAGLAGGNSTQTAPLGNGTLTLTGGTGYRSWVTPLSGNGGVVIATQGVQALIGENTYAGPTTVTSGTLRTTYGTLVNSASTTVNAAAGLQVIVPADTVWSPASVSVPGALVKQGPGKLTFDGSVAAPQPASLAIAAGEVVLDRSSNNTSAIGTPALSLGARLTVLGNNSAPSTQTFGTTTTLTGGSRVTVNAGADQNATLELGALVRRPGTGAAVDFRTVNNGTGIASVTVSTPNNAGGIVGGFATVGGTDWATATGASAPYVVGALASGSYTTAWTNGHTSVTTNTTVASGAVTRTLRFATPGVTSVTLAGANTVTFGGILVTPAVGASDIVISGGGASLRTGAAEELVIHQYNTAGSLRIGVPIANVVGPSVSFSGVTFSGAANASALVTLPSVDGIGIGYKVGGLVNGRNGTVVDVDPVSRTVRIAYSNAANGNVTATNLVFAQQQGVVKTGPGSLILSNSNTFQGALQVTEGTVTLTGATTYGNNSGSQGSATLFLNGGAINATAGFSTASATQHWVIGPKGGTINLPAGTQQLVKQGNTFFGVGDLRITGGGTFGVGTNLSQYTGHLYIDNGILRLTSNQLRLAAGMTVAAGSQYLIDDDTSTVFSAGAGGPLVLNGNGPGGSGAFRYIYTGANNGTMTFDSPVILASDSRFTVVKNGSAEGFNVFTSPITGPGNLIKDGDGTVRLFNPSNTYGGANGLSVIRRGTLQLGVNNGVPTTSTVQFGEAGSSDAGSFDLNGFNQTVAGLTSVTTPSGFRVINSQSATTMSSLTVSTASGQNQTYAGRVGGDSAENFSVTKSGPGTLSLSGLTTFTGPLTVAQGTLRVGENAVARDVIVADGATLTLANAGGNTMPVNALTLGTGGTTSLAFEFLSSIPSSGAVAVNTADGLSLSGTVNVTVSSVQGLTVSQFPLIRYTGSIGGAGFSALSLTLPLPSRSQGTLVNNIANGTIDLRITSVDALRWRGNLSADWDIATTQNFVLQSDGSAQVYLDQPGPDSVTFDDLGAGGTVNLTTTVSPASTSVDSSFDYTFAGPGRLSGPTTLAKSGSGTLRISTNNNNTGATFINGGTVIVGDGATSGSLGSGNVTVNGQLTFDRTDDVTFAGAIGGSGSVTKLNGGKLTLLGASNFGGNLTIDAGVVSATSGSIGGSVLGNGSLEKTGPGLLSVAGDISVPNTLVVSGGTLQVGGALTPNVTVATSSAIAFNRSGQYTYGGTITGTGGIAVTGGSIKLTGSLGYTGTTSVGSNTLEFATPNDVTLSATLSGTGEVIKSADSTLRLIANNSAFTGKLTINDGTVHLIDIGQNGNIDARTIEINSGGKFIFGLGVAYGGIPDENPDLPAQTRVVLNPGGEFESRIGEVWGATTLSGGTLSYDGALGATMDTTYTGENAGFDARSGLIRVGSNAGTGSATLTASISSSTGQGGFNKTTPDTVYIQGRLNFGDTTPISILEGTLAADPTAVPTGVSASNPNAGLITIATGARLQITGPGTGTSPRPIQLADTATVDVADAAGRLNLSGTVTSTGTFNKTGLGTLAFSGTTAPLNFSTLKVTGGNLLIQRPLRPATGSLVVAGPGARLTVDPSLYATPAGYSLIQLPSVVVGESSQSGVSTFGIGVTNRTSGTNAARASVVVTPAISIASDGSGNLVGRIDVGNNDMILTGAASALATVRSWAGAFVTSGGNVGLGSTLGSSTSAPFTTVAIIANNLVPDLGYFATYDGVSLTANDVIVKYTYVGDTDLDGALTGADLVNVIEGFSTGMTGWQNGDVNYDNVVNALDLQAFIAAYEYYNNPANNAPNWGNGSGTLAPTGGAIPEPSSLGLLAAALPVLTRRRRSR